MIAFIKSNKLLVLVLILVVGGLLSYKMFFLSPEAAPPLTAAHVDGTASPVSQNLLGLLASLRTIHLDSSIFASPVFTSLTNFDTEIAKEPVGKENPFTPYVGISVTNFQNSLVASPTLLKLPLGKKNESSH